MGLFKKKIKIVNKDGVEEIFKVKRDEEITADTLDELSNNKGDDEPDVE